MSVTQQQKQKQQQQAVQSSSQALVNEPAQPWAAAPVAVASAVPSVVVDEPRPQAARRGRGLLYSLKTELRDVSAPLWMRDLSATLHEPREQISTGMHRISSTLWYAGRSSLE